MLRDYVIKEFGIDEKVYDFCLKAEESAKTEFKHIDEVTELNQYKVLRAMQKVRLSDTHFNPTTGYGYNDLGRDALEDIYAGVFKAEAALVRAQLISGTHALTVALSGNLRYGDRLLSVAGAPYDTMESVIGAKREVKGSLTEYGIKYDEVALQPDGSVDLELLRQKLKTKTKLALIQRSKGYEYRPSLTIENVKKIIEIIKLESPETICMVDNCYCEFVNTKEPIEVGADIAVGSLIKNPGGGLAPVGGYIVGKKEYVENAAYRLTAPSMGREVGPSLGVTAQLIQGFFFAPTVVNAALKGAAFASRIFSGLGFECMPKPNEPRPDIVEAIQLKTPEAVIAFCQGIQRGAAVDSYVDPEPWDMPGYDTQVIMAAGAFVQGSSIELSADAPMKEPYTVYMQGGLTWYHAKIGIMIAVNNLYKKGIIAL